MFVFFHLRMNLNFMKCYGFEAWRVKLFFLKHDIIVIAFRNKNIH